MSKRKPDGQKQDGRKSRQLVPLASKKVDPPSAPEYWPDQIKRAWVMLWKSPVAAMFDDVDQLPVYRLFDLYTMRWELRKVYENQPFVKGSAGPDRLNPAFDAMTKLDTAIQSMEDRLGISPKARLQLGVKLLEAKRATLRDRDGSEILERQVIPKPDRSVPERQRPDPRVPSRQRPDPRVKKREDDE